MRLMLCALLVIAAGCSDSPTAPTPVGAALGPLRWDVVSGSCAPMPPPSPLPETSNASMRVEENNQLTASWPYSVNGRSVVLYAHFVRENGAWALCRWDTADV